MHDKATKLQTTLFRCSSDNTRDIPRMTVVFPAPGLLVSDMINHTRKKAIQIVMQELGKSETNHP